MKNLLSLLVITLLHLCCFSQQLVTKSIKDFGAKGNGRTNDQEAFAKATAFFNTRKGQGKLIIPKGIYLVGGQKLSAKDNEHFARNTGETALEFRNCSNFQITGTAGSIIKNLDSLRIGTFYPSTGKAFKHSIKDINTKPEYAGYGLNVGNIIMLINCSNVIITSLTIDGNCSNFIFGGTWGNGRNPYELIHYGIYVSDSHDISISNCNIKNFACDGIYIANIGQQLKTYTININQCKVNFCGRNALSWIGGENIKVCNSEFSNSGQGKVAESPSAGISIEVENSSYCRKGYFYNCKMENNVGSGITSGSGKLSSDILFKKCLAASPVYYTVFADAASHRFEDCKFYGTVLVWYRGVEGKDGMKFSNCAFDENYKGKKMYDGSYLFGAEATGVTIDHCIFHAYSTADYYLNGLGKDCSPGNSEKLRVSNSSFYSYNENGSTLGNKIAGIAGRVVFYNNKFYAYPGVNFLNDFNGKCFADGGKNEFYPVIQK